MTGSAQEQEVPGEAQEARRTLVMALPGTPVSSIWGLVGQLGAGVEHAVSPHVALVGSVQVSASLQGTDSFYRDGSGSSGQTWGVGVDPGVHFYLTGRAPEGLWVGPHLELGTYHWTTRNEYLMPEPNSGGVELVTVESRSRTVQYGGSARVGYTAILAPGLTFQVGAGLSALSSRSTLFGTPSAGSGGPANASMNNIRNWSLSPRMTLGVGWAF
ncbi:hypothetical protein Q664_20600 [Archangium violaceum Cb vi76]|uniref:Outer membrane protein beta-barrel domain-containing protein n=2 Tax=Archangium violaceum TaxID=83451 RepID=A0A084ST80_9BACT|nr:hypothetical protein Q664_20600 [Archangium violaceum Cb vi76]